MNEAKFLNPKNTNSLYNLSKHFNFLKNLYIKRKLPKVIMLSGQKGIGKSTLVNHLMHFIYDNQNYDTKKFQISNESFFNKQFKNNTYSNIIYFSNSINNNIKIDEIRNLKERIFKTPILDKERFIIFDDIELSNKNTLNALLKIIEEPGKNNFFILINNKIKPIIETIKSRCIELKLFLNNTESYNIIKSLVEDYEIKTHIDPEKSNLSPGFFLIFNKIIGDNNLDLKDDLIKNINLFIILYKKEKKMIYIDFIKFLINRHFDFHSRNKNSNKFNLTEDKFYLMNNINNFFTHNLNENSLINVLNNKVNNE